MLALATAVVWGFFKGRQLMMEQGGPIAPKDRHLDLPPITSTWVQTYTPAPTAPTAGSGPGGH